MYSLHRILSLSSHGPLLRHTNVMTRVTLSANQSRQGIVTSSREIKTAPPDVIDLRNTQDAYRSKSMRDLLRAYIVFRMCSYETLLKHQKQILTGTRRMLGRRLFKGAMRMSVYGQFMAGEAEKEILQVAHRHHDHGVRPMYAYTASESHGDAQGMIGSSQNEDTFQLNYKAMQESVEMAKLSPRMPGEYVKVSGKLTGLGPPSIFRATTTLIDTNTHLVSIATAGSTDHAQWTDIRDTLEHLVTSQGPGSLSEVCRETGLPLPANYRSLDWRSLTTCQAFHLAASRCTKLAQLVKEAALVDSGLQHCPLTSDEETEILEIWTQMADLAERASRLDACLVVDAEQTYLQSSMDLITLDLMRKYNTKRPVVHNTYQCYLRRTHDVICRDLNSAKAEGFCLGAKVVRGGYMDEERKLAAEKGYPDPVNATFADTTAMYYKVAHELISRHLEGTTLQATFATHNEDTVKHIINLMEVNGVKPDRNVFSFAQLIGMRDHIAFILGKKKLPANKLLHYGDVENCVAYLSRRLTENKSGVPTADVERSMIGAEIRRRMRTGEALRFRRKSVV